MKCFVRNKSLWSLGMLLLVCGVVSAQEPKKVCMDVGQFKFRVTKTEVVDTVKGGNGTLSPKDGAKILVVTLSGLASDDCNFEGLAIESFFVVRRATESKNPNALKATSASAFSGFGDKMWFIGPGSTGISVKKGEVVWSVAFAVPAEVTEFWMGLPSTLPVAVKIGGETTK